MLKGENSIKNEGGFVLVITMMILLVLTLFGMFATRTAIVELQISGNDKVATSSFYKADGNTELAVNMIEENLSCPIGFVGGVSDSDEDTFLVLQAVDVADKKFAYDEAISDVAQDGFTGTPVLKDFSTDDVRSMRIAEDPSNRVDTSPHGNLMVFGETAFATGSAIQMSAGYEGKGHGAAGGGAYIAENIFSRQYGKVNSQALLQLEWRHVIGQEGVCRY